MTVRQRLFNGEQDDTNKKQNMISQEENPLLHEKSSEKLQTQDKDSQPDSSNGNMKMYGDNRRNGTGMLVICFLGIFISYLIFGILQERITRGKYGDGTDKFNFIQVLVFIQCVVNSIFAKSAIILRRGSAHDFVKDHTPWLLYAACSTSYVGAMLASNNALKFVSYPTQVIGKSCKPLAVMILGILWAKKRYTKEKAFCVCLIVAGVSLFMYNPEKAKSGQSGITFGWGEALLLLSLTLDGFTGAFQEKMRSEEYRTTEHVMMYNMNFYSCAILGVTIVLSGEYQGFISFATKYPNIWTMIGVFSICSAIGQHFIFLTVVTFGPLTCSVITTTRKFFTVLCSVFLFRNPMTLVKWLATSLVFLGLSLDTIIGKKKRSK